LSSIEYSVARGACFVPAAGRLLFALLERMEYGVLTLKAPDGVARRFGGGSSLGAQHIVPTEADLTLRDWGICGEVMRGGDVAFAEAYMDGRWDTSDLIALLTVVGFNQRALERAFYGLWWRQLLLRLRHLARGNTRRHARRNACAHYDLGNDFYRLWLDPTMTYSAALFEGDPSRSLASAQQTKHERILASLRLPAAAHLLEIGCGWGSFAETAARAGHRVTAISLSKAQTAYALEHLANAGLSDRVELRIEDYRDVKGRFDGIASIEMFEAVGERYWPAYFRILSDALRPDARAVVQTITIADQRFDRYRQTSDFIQEYIFPGGMLASASRFAAEAHAAGLKIEGMHRFGHDYAETLERWLAAFDAQVDAVRALGFDQRFIRCWRFYLAYCAAGFTSETTDVAQYTLSAR